MAGRFAAGLALALLGAVAAVAPAAAAEPTPLRITEMTLGSDHSCVLQAGGTVACWGSNLVGQAGSESKLTAVFLPTAVALTGDATSIGRGVGHTCAVLGNGQVACWGDNTFWQLGRDDTGGSYRPVTVLTPSGDPLSDAVAVAAGHDFSCAVERSGHVACWGRDSAGQLGDEGTFPNFAAPVHGIDDAVAISAGWAFACALRAGGTVACWGENGFGQGGSAGGGKLKTATPIQHLSGVRKLAAGWDNACALLGNGHVTCWGANTFGQLADGTTNPSATPRTIPGIADAVDLAVGYADVCVVRASGELWCWGHNADGTIGDGSKNNNRPVPTKVASLSKVVAVAAGESHTCALRADNGLWCWGFNGTAQLGTGNTTEHLLPFQVAALVSPPSAPTDVTATVSGNTATVAWKPSAISGGSNLVGYLLRALPGGQTIVASPSATKLAFPGLADSHQYRFTVQALTATVTGYPSAPSNAVWVDQTPPFGSPPLVTARVGTTMTAASIPVTVSWSAVEKGSGIATWTVQKRTGAGAWKGVTLPSATATSWKTTVAAGATVRAWRAKAKDVVGNQGTWAEHTGMVTSIVQQDGAGVSVTGTWATAASASALGGTLRTTSTGGSRLTFTFTGSSVAWIGPVGPTRGSASVSVDGGASVVVDSHATSATGRTILFARSWATAGPHTVTITCAATPGHPRIDVDAFVVINP